MEFALTRFLETDSGVYVVVYSHKLSSDKGKKINVDVVMKNKEKWIQELLEMPVDSIKQRS